MKVPNYLVKYYSIVFALLLFAYAFSINSELTRPYVVISKQDETWNLNDEMINKFNLGFKRLESSFLWISTILESDIEHYKKKDSNSWMFRRFYSIAKLEPKFYENYAFGGVYLSIIKDDIKGASIIFNLGLDKFPYEYPLLRDASFHFFYEAKDFNRAFQITQTVKKMFPDKYTLIGMTSKLEAENGNLESALATLTRFQDNYKRGNLIGDKIFQNRYSLKAEIDLNCLNKLKRKDCSMLDLNGLTYLYNDQIYKAQSSWEPYRRKSFHKNNKVPKAPH